MYSEAQCLHLLTIFRSTIETWSIEIGSQRLSNSTLDQPAFLTNQLHTTTESELCSNWLSSGNEANETGQAAPEFLDNVFDHLDSQFWLTPSGVAWNHWDSLLSNGSVTDSIE